MASVNVQTQTSFATEIGYLGRLVRRFYDSCMDSSMYRIAPTRKM